MKNTFKNLGRHLILLFFLLFALIPLYWIFITSIKSPEELYELPLRYFPRSPSLANYSELFSFAEFASYFINSLLVTLSAAIAALIISILAGYAISRNPLKKASLMLLLYVTQMIPPFILMIPLYSTLTRLKMTDNLFILSIVYVATVVAFSTIMAKSFFDRVPRSLDDAASIDGCDGLQLLWRVMVPVMRPGLAAIFCFSFVNIWNELFLAAILISTGSKLTVPVALNSFISKAGISWGLLSAGIVVALLPTMFVFAFGQRYIIAGLTQGAVKG